ncbi:MAG: LuxR C-terminal-related transcriptional regulator [Actinomycetaceae bacterium]|nr:LuxR C-terminal-related transcriptional regulator [Actinomycetaceae bacterium]
MAMQLAIFYYSLVILLISVITATMCLAVHILTKRRTYLYLFVSFFLYFFDVALVFRRYFQNGVRPLPQGSTDQYNIGSPIESMALASAIIVCFVLFLFTYLKQGGGRYVALLIVSLFLAYSWLVLAIFPIGKHREFMFFSSRSIAVATLLIFVTYKYFTASTQIERRSLRTHLSLYVACWIGLAATLANNLYLQLLRPPGSISFILSEQNFGENLLVIICASYTIRSCVRALNVRYAALPPPTDHAQQYLEHALARFARSNELTVREREVLQLIINGHENRKIAEELFLSPSTVKVHVHNILRKTGKANRKALLQAFWEQV